MDRRVFLSFCAAWLTLVSVSGRALADKGRGGGDDGGSDSDGGSGSDGGGDSDGGGNDSDSGGSGSGHDDDSGSDDKDDNDSGNDGDRDDDDGQKAARDAVKQGRAVPLRAVVRAVKRKYEDCDVIDVKLQKRGANLVYKVRIVEKSGKRRTLTLDAHARRFFGS